jgi:mono/diheme cytochrome c family protein
MAWRSIALQAAVIAAIAYPGAAQETAPNSILAELGAPLFQRHCAACHGADGRGDGPAAKALVTPPADLTTIAARRGGTFPPTIAQFIDGRFEVTAHGSREMPVWGQRFGADVPDAGVGESIARGNIATLVEYLKSIQRPPLSRREPPKP